MTLWRQILASYVALCVAFAGAVGLSPVLHHWVEHGGEGPAHIHSRSAPVRVHTHPHAHTHGANHGHPHSHDPDFAGFPPAPRATFATAHPDFRVSPATLAAAWQALTDFFRNRGAERSDASSDPTHPDHQHHSLAQLLADGWVEAALDAPQLARPQLPPLDLGFVPSLRLHALPWDAQTAGRAPPQRSA